MIDVWPTHHLTCVMIRTSSGLWQNYSSFLQVSCPFCFITQSSFSFHLESAEDKGANNTTNDDLNPYSLILNFLNPSNSNSNSNDDGNTANGGSMTFKKALEISYKFRSSAVNDTISGFMSTFFYWNGTRKNLRGGVGIFSWKIWLPRDISLGFGYRDFFPPTLRRNSTQDAPLSITTSPDFQPFSKENKWHRAPTF